MYKYLNGKRKVKEFYDNGQIKRESEYIDYKLWNGKIYEKR